MRLTRRGFMKGAGAVAGTVAAGTLPSVSVATPPLAKPIPSSGELLPAVGLGSWITFNVGNDPVLRKQCTAVMRVFFERGGGMIDSSPMYGSSQEVIGDGWQKLGRPSGLFSTDKVWTSAGAHGPEQIAETEALWGVSRFDLMQVHNLVNWQAHLETLFAMKAEGRLRYVGITTSHGRQHREFEQVMRRYPLDFVQLTYNIVDRAVEQRLLPLAAERRIAVICNRPFRRGELPDRFQGEKLPSWAAEIGVETWPAFLLKFIVSHPAVTVAIPATRQVEHLRENKAAEFGPVPDEAMRQRMAGYVRSL